MQDVLHVCEALSADDKRKQKALLDRLMAILTKLGQRGYAVREELGEYRVGYPYRCRYRYRYRYRYRLAG